MDSVSHRRMTSVPSSELPPLLSSREAAHQVVRGKVSARQSDRAFSQEIAAVAELVREGMFDRFVPGLLRDLGCE
jgi:histidine ammonia-lyase